MGGGGFRQLERLVRVGGNLADENSHPAAPPARGQARGPGNWSECRRSTTRRNWTCPGLHRTGGPAGWHHGAQTGRAGYPESVGPVRHGPVWAGGRDTLCESVNKVSKYRGCASGSRFNGGLADGTCPPYPPASTRLSFTRFTLSKKAGPGRAGRPGRQAGPGEGRGWQAGPAGTRARAGRGGREGGRGIEGGANCAASPPRHP